jgi:hypothetical protein
MRFHNDEPTLDDQLDRDELVKSLGDQIATCDPPQVFGIHGDWGAGKTSFLHRLQVYLTADCPQQTEAVRKKISTLFPTWGQYKDAVTVVWFEAWRYQHDQAPIVALLQEIRTQLPWYSKALQESKKMGEVTVRSALLAFEDLTRKIGIQASKIQEVGERWEQENLATVLPSHMVRQHLEHALRTLLGESKAKKQPRRLVVMIDDLDRCESQSAYKLLEGIKIYLNLPNCVFVLGMNQSIIEGAVAEHIPKTEDSALRSLRAREYMEKLCQTLIHLPIARKPADLLGHHLDGVPGQVEICKVIEDHGCLPVNPRKIKAYANLLRRYAPTFAAKLNNPAQATNTAELIVIFSCLYHFHPELYRIVEANRRFYEFLSQWANGTPNLPEYALLKGLETPQVIQTAGGASPFPQTTARDAYVDPAAGNVFRLQSLMQKVNAVNVTTVEEYLVR